MPCLEFANGTKPDQSAVQNFTLGRDVFSVKFEMAQFVATPGGFLVIYTGQAATGPANQRGQHPLDLKRRHRRASGKTTYRPSVSRMRSGNP